jgi:hypothetical protein
VVNATLVVEEDLNQLIRWTSGTPFVELEKETGKPHARARSRSPRRAEAKGVGVAWRGVAWRGVDVDVDVDGHGRGVAWRRRGRGRDVLRCSAWFCHS